MAAISSISNGEAMSSVRTKLNQVITEINLLDPTDWVDYSATSTIVGWSSFTTKVLKYRIVGKQMFVFFNFDGVSNSTLTSFTLPNNALFFNEMNGRFLNNGALTSGYYRTQSNSNIIEILSSISGAAWASSGTKFISGQFFIQIA